MGFLNLDKIIPMKNVVSIESIPFKYIADEDAFTELRKDYRNYFNLPAHLKNERGIVDEAIRSCIGFQLSNSENRNIDEAHNRVIRFIERIRIVTNRDIQSWIEKGAITFSNDEYKAKTLKKTSVVSLNEYKNSKSNISDDRYDKAA